MFEKIEITYKEVKEEKERLNRIAEILSEGVYGYLKKSGYLKYDAGRANKINNLLKKVEKLGNLAEGKIN